MTVTPSTGWRVSMPVEMRKGSGPIYTAPDGTKYRRATIREAPDVVLETADYLRDTPLRKLTKAELFFIEAVREDIRSNRKKRSRL